MAVVSRPQRLTLVCGKSGGKQAGKPAGQKRYRDEYDNINFVENIYTAEITPVFPTRVVVSCS